MTSNIVTFGYDRMTEMATFCAELTRGGVAFRAYDAGGEYRVEIAGY